MCNVVTARCSIRGCGPSIPQNRQREIENVRDTS